MNIEENKEEIDLLEILNVLWIGRIKIICITILFAIFSVIYSLSIPDKYISSTLLAPKESTSSGGMQSKGQIGSLASFAGLNIGQNQINQSQLAQEIMISWKFIEGFVLRHDLSPEIIAVQDWDKDTKTLIYNENIYDIKNKNWNIKKPSSWEIYLSFLDILSVSEDRQSGLITISIKYFSPDHAKMWLDLFVNSINKHMQERSFLETTKNIKYLEDEIKKTTNNEMQKIFYNIIQDETKKQMLSSVGDEYVFTVVNPSMISEIKSEPRRSFICIMGTMLGAFISVLIVLLTWFLRKPS